jgi:predicted nucleic acid-binding protein
MELGGGLVVALNTVIDANGLIYLLDRRDVGLRDRMKGLLQQIEAARGQLVIPTPVIAEYLAHAGTAGQAILSALIRNKFVTVAPFDHRAAVECAELDATAKKTGNKRHPLGHDVLWQKVKVDRQVVAIAKVWAADVVAEDRDIINIAKAAGVSCRRISSLPLPASLAQMQLLPQLHPALVAQPSPKA